MYKMRMSLWRFTDKNVSLALFNWFYWRLKVRISLSSRHTPKFNLVAKC